MNNPQHAPTAEIIRATVLEAILQHQGMNAFGRNANVDAELAAAIADAVVKRLASVEQVRKSADKYDLGRAVHSALSKVLSKERIPDDNLRNAVLGLVVQHEAEIADALLKTFGDQLDGGRQE